MTSVWCKTFFLVLLRADDERVSVQRMWRFSHLVSDRSLGRVQRAIHARLRVVDVGPAGSAAFDTRMRVTGPCLKLFFVVASAPYYAEVS